jgi:alkanesulfonate monooxygenase SsuD/methylene tetrahydromethanopterin reductase-like flavin-dependent oxidoreductase (luciferase family)
MSADTDPGSSPPRSAAAEPLLERPLLLGLHVLSYGEPWSEVERVGRLADRLGYDLLLGADHLYATGGDIHEPFFEGWLTLAAWGQRTQRVHIGLLVGANPFRNPGLVAKMLTTLDHQTSGRAVLGLGAGWMTRELADHGLPTDASLGQRLHRLDEALAIIRTIGAGTPATHRSARYTFDAVRHEPRPLQPRIPVLVGASGPRVGMRIVARHADLWQWWAPMGTLDGFRGHLEVLAGHCAELGRDPTTIHPLPGAKVIIRDDPRAAERVFLEAARRHGWSGEVLAGIRESTWLATTGEVTDAIGRYRDAGARGFICQAFGPYDDETIERLAREVRAAL